MSLQLCPLISEIFVSTFKVVQSGRMFFISSEVEFPANESMFSAYIVRALNSLSSDNKMVIGYIDIPTISVVKNSMCVDGPIIFKAKQNGTIGSAIMVSDVVGDFKFDPKQNNIVFASNSIGIVGQPQSIILSKKLVAIGDEVTFYQANASTMGM